MDADGDEIMGGHGRDELGSGEGTELILSEDTLKQIGLRKGEHRVPDTLRFCSCYALSDVRC